METKHLPPLPVKEPPSFGPAGRGGGGPPSSPGRQVAHYNWSHAHMRYLPNEARKEAEAAILAAQAEASKQRSGALEALQAQHAAERRAREADRREAQRAEDDEDTRLCQAKEYELRIQTLERTLAAERASHAAELQDRARQMEENRADARLRVDHEQRRCAAAVQAAEARAQEAVRSEEEVRLRAQEAVAASRASEEARVKEARASAEERVRRHEQQKRQEMEQLRAEVAAERAAIEERCRMYMEQGHKAVEEARRRIDSNEKGVQIWMSSKEIQLAKKEADWSEWGSQKKQQQHAFEAHHKQLLELEKDLHGKTMNRTLGRVVRHLKFGGDADLEGGGRDTPTRELLQSAVAPSPPDCCGEGETRRRVGLLGLGEA